MRYLLFTALLLPFNILCLLMVLLYTIVVLLPTMGVMIVARFCGADLDGNMTFNFRWMKVV